MKKRIIGILMTAMMVVVCIPAMVFADTLEYGDTDGIVSMVYTYSQVTSGGSRHVQKGYYPTVVDSSNVLASYWSEWGENKPFLCTPNSLNWERYDLSVDSRAHAGTYTAYYKAQSYGTGNTWSPVATFQIAKKKIDLLVANDKIYDGTAIATLGGAGTSANGVSFDGGTTYDEITLTDTTGVTAKFVDSNKADAVDVGTYDLKITGTPTFTIALGENSASLTDDYQITTTGKTASIVAKSVANTDQTDKKVKIVLSSYNYMYNGEVFNAPEMIITYNGMILDEDDYDVTGTKTATDAGTYTMTVTGKGNYCDSVDVEWTIAPRPIIDENVKITLDAEFNKYQNTGKEVTPKLTIKYNGRTLVEGVDYEVSGITSASREGKYTMTVTGKGNFSFTKDIEWSIGAASVPVTPGVNTADNNDLAPFSVMFALAIIGLVGVALKRN